ncbi:hypothetical protein [Flavobacterium sp. IMCC34518]|uniref:hypothetical protein n=1 Tax=Flavobacterium sp. IMCC34518 TaxID=3003623 RepID=UPI002482D039|nr:hypothetical protein [Flavobacterium sp. IMCC34518]
MEAKRNLFYLIYVMFFITHLMLAQNEAKKYFSSKDYQKIYFQTGINLSIPAHDDLMRTHLFAIGINIRIAKIISDKLEVGVRMDYDYRFSRKNIPDSIPLFKAAHRNFSIASFKPNLQLNLKKNWYWGLETGIGFVFSDEDNKTGFGFVEEYDGNTRIGSCSALYIGKHISLDTKINKLDLSLNWSNFFTEKHAENFACIKLNYSFDKINNH